MLLLYSFNPKFSTGKRKKCTLISHFASATGGRPLRLAPFGKFMDPPTVNPIQFKILATWFTITGRSTRIGGWTHI